MREASYFSINRLDRAMELMQLSTYEFKLDKNFVLHITNESVATPTVMLVSEDSTAGAVQSIQV